MSAPSRYRAPSFSSPVDLDLSKNEGRPWALGDAISSMSLEDASRYPDLTPLRDALSHRLGVEAERLLVTAGGDDALLRVFMANAGRRLAVTTPTFEMIGRYAEQTGCQLIEVEWWAGPFPIDEFVAARGQGAELAVIVSPNNPTGSTATPADVLRAAAAFDFVILDATYAEFADDGLAAAASEVENVVVVRTMSKAFGLAGLRVGCLIGSPEAVSRLAAYGSPYPVSGVSARLAMTVLENVEVVKSFVDEVVAERKALPALVTELGGSPLPSQANFVLSRFPSADWLLAGARSLGVGLRGFPGRSDLAGCVRITLPGEPAAFRRLTETLAAVLSPQALLFDMDGVLADVSGSYTTATLATAAWFGVDVSATDITAAKAAGGANDDWELTRRLCRVGGVEVPLADVRRRFDAFYHGEAGGSGMKENERPLLDEASLGELASRLPLAVVTGRPRDEAEEFLERFGMRPFISSLVTRDDAAAMKPDPAPVRAALEELGVSRAWMVGDTPDDLAAALGAGVVPIGVVAPGEDPIIASEALAAAAVVLASTTEVLEVLDAAGC